MPSLFARQDAFSDARNTFSSWDTCMAKVYCKWPVIVGIILGSLVLISVVTCIARCICCGAECACCCFRCCTCCCTGGGGSGHRRMKSNPTPAYPAPYPVQPQYSASLAQANPYAHAHAVAPRASTDSRPVNQQYRSNAMPVFGAVHAPERPQFATFDSTRAVVNEDALPAMPTWKDGREVHVEIQQEAVPEKRGDVELDRLDHNGSTTSASAVGGARRSPATDSHGFPPGYYHNSNDSFANAVPPRMSPGPQRGPYAPQDEYRRASPGSNRSPVYAAPRDQKPQQYGRQSPAQPQQVYHTYDEQEHYPQHTTHSSNHYDYDHEPTPYTHHSDPYTSPAPPPPPPPPQYIDYSGPAPPPPPQYIDYSGPAPPPQQPQQQPYQPPQHMYPPSESTLYEPPSASTTPAPAPSAYPGQRAYNASPVQPAQSAYQAFQPGR